VTVMPSNHVGTFQLKTCGDVPVKVHKAANKLSKSTVIPKKTGKLHKFFFFKETHFYVTG